MCKISSKIDYILSNIDLKNIAYIHIFIITKILNRFYYDITD